LAGMWRLGQTPFGHVKGRYQRLSRSSKYLDLDIPAVVRFVRIWVVGTFLGLVLITNGRLIPGLVIII
jgi:hypothetical protein